MKEKTYCIPYLYVYSEEDNYENGCVHKSGKDSLLSYGFEHKTQSELVKALCGYLEVKPEEIDLNACDEAGRVDISRLENNAGHKASEAEIEQWKQGLCRLFNVTYTGYLHLKTPVEFERA
jgi:hypothetical protein